jgi:hypothetical protein
VGTAGRHWEHAAALQALQDVHDRFRASREHVLRACRQVVRLGCEKPRVAKPQTLDSLSLIKDLLIRSIAMADPVTFIDPPELRNILEG